MGAYASETHWKYLSFLRVQAEQYRIVACKNALWKAEEKKIIKPRKWKGNPPKPRCQLLSKRFARAIWKALLRAQLTKRSSKHTCLRDPGPLWGFREATLPLPRDVGRKAMFGPHHGSPGSLCPVTCCPPDLHTLHLLQSPEYKT